MPGPAPSPQARRRNKGQSFTELPTVCERPVPVWPLASPSDRELSAWTEIWRTPMAERWHQLGWTYPIARYVRLHCQWEAAPTKRADLLSELRLMEDRIGAHSRGLQNNRWSISDEPADGEDGSVVPLHAVGE